MLLENTLKIIVQYLIIPKRIGRKENNPLSSTEDNGLCAVYMQLFRKEKVIPVVDIHSHILPGIDDGSKSMEQSVEMMEIAREEGIAAVIATPHNMPGKGKADKVQVTGLIKELKEECEKQELFMPVLPGCEIFYREEVLDLLEQGEIQTLNNTAFVLVEFDYMSERSYIRNALKDILGLGFQPILAHVERYPSLMGNDYKEIKEFRRMHIRIQVNASSVCGNAGKVVQKHVKRMLKEELVDFVATDAHGTHSRAPGMCSCTAQLRKWCKGEYVERILYKNALDMLQVNLNK